jgi:predicted ferric reductase
VLWAIMTAAFVWLLVWVRLLRPLRIRRRPWTVERVTAERDRTTVLTLRPVGHDGLRFEPGQFAWITVGRSPFSVTSHPFSFCSSAELNGSVEVAIKDAGDFSSSVATVEPGTEVYLDGPHGVFSIDQYEGAGFGLIAGGVGIAPALSMLETLADRADVRPVVLFAGNRNSDSIILRDRINRLATRLNLTAVHVLEEPPPDWPGETGYIDADILARYLPTSFRRFQYFACGPTPMLAAVETALVGIGAPADRIHTERFDWV